MKKTMLPLTLSLTGAASLLAAVTVQSQSKPSHPAERNSHSPAPRQAPRVAALRAAAALGTRLSPEERRKSDEISAHGHQIHLAAQALLQEGKLEEAEQKCREEIAYYQSLGGRSTVNQLLGDIQLAQGKYQDALDTYAIVHEHEDDARLSLSEALCYVRLGDLEKARKALRACANKDMARLADDPSVEGTRITGDLKSMEVTLLMLLGNTAPGGDEVKLKYYMEAEKLAPDDWAIADTIGQRLDYLYRRDDAVPYYRRAIKLGGDKVSYEHRMRVEMFDLRQKQQDAQSAPVEPSAPH